MYRALILVLGSKKIKGATITTDNKLGTTDLLFLQAKQMNLQPEWITNKYLFSIMTKGGARYINGSTSTLNSQVDSALVRNKYHTRLILERSNLPNIPYMRPKNLQEAARFIDEHTTIIVKPVSGQGAQDINIVHSVKQIEHLNIKHYIFEKYVAGTEMRYLILNDDVIAVHQSDYGTSVAEDRYLERLSFAKEDWDATLTKIALTVVKVFRLKFAAVDFLIDESGKDYVLEVNTSPGLKWFHAPTSGPAVDVAALFFDALLSQ